MLVAAPSLFCTSDKALKILVTSARGKSLSPSVGLFRRWLKTARATSSTFIPTAVGSKRPCNTQIEVRFARNRDERFEDFFRPKFEDLMKIFGPKSEIVRFVAGRGVEARREEVPLISRARGRKASKPRHRATPLISPTRSAAAFSSWVKVSVVWAGGSSI